jgi:hypothetical protein
MADSISLKMVLVGQEGSTTVSADLSSTMLQVAQAFLGVEENIAQRYRFSSNGQHINPRLTLRESGFIGGEEVHYTMFPKGRKPVIYILSPENTDIEASVTLSLVPEWCFSSLYPVVPICRSTHGSKEKITWRVYVRPGGQLTELKTGLDVAYLFWEAQSVAATLCDLGVIEADILRSRPQYIAPLSPPPSPVSAITQEERHGMFNPLEASLDDGNSILIPVQQITTYLDKSLRDLGLHTEARTSFIT